MLKVGVWRGVVLVFAATVLAACGGGGGSSGTAQVRLVNATSTHASLTMLANGANAVGATSVDTVSSYGGVPSGGPTLQINDGTSGTALATLAPTVSTNAHYAVVAYESGGSIHTTVIAEDVAAPASNTTSLRIIDAASDAGAIDVYLTDPAVDIATLTSPTFTFSSSTSLQTSAFVSLAPGTYRLRVTGGGNPGDLRLDVASITLTNQEVASILLTPTTGGTLANGAVIAQQGAYTAARNPKVRVRLAAAVSGGATVTATTGGTTIGSNVSPSVGSYVVVPAGAINVSVNGASVGGAAVPTPGSDSTLLVYTSATGTTATLIADDNRLPAATTNLKLRLINGLTGSATPLTLDAAFAVIASNVAPGTASPYAVVASSTALRIDVFTPTSLTPIYTDSTLSVPGNAVYTLFMLGDAGSPTALLRRDR